jgi:hypothetical protein
MSVQGSLKAFRSAALPRSSLSLPITARCNMFVEDVCSLVSCGGSRLQTAMIYQFFVVLVV